MSLFQTAARLCSRALLIQPQRASSILFRPENPGIPFARDGIEETSEEYDQRYIKYFSRPDIDGWELRKGINDMHCVDVTPDPKVVVEVLKACRRVNDHSLAVRYLESIYRKLAYKKEYVNWMMWEIRPTINELGISAPEELGYDKPELALGDPDRCSFV